MQCLNKECGYCLDKIWLQDWPMYDEQMDTEFPWSVVNYRYLYKKLQKHVAQLQQTS
jgi:hypothetical protein